MDNKYWIGLTASLANTTTTSDCQTPSGQIPGTARKKGQMAMEGKTEKKRV